MTGTDTRTSEGRSMEGRTSTYKRVTLHGERLWIERNHTGNTPLAPTHHITADGELDYTRCFDGPSYAHVYGTVIKRHGVQIGTVADLVDGWLAATEAHS